MSFSVQAATLQRDEERNGFIVSSVTPLPDLRAVAYLLSHKKSGAGLLHLHNEDPENLFTIAFRTPRRTAPASPIFLSTPCSADPRSTR